jgi:multidrug efflux pump
VPTAVYHDGGELSATLSFNLGDGVSIEQGRQAVLDAVGAIGMPNNVRGIFGRGRRGAASPVAAGPADRRPSWSSTSCWACCTSLIHPVTVLTTLPRRALARCWRCC